MTYSLITTGNFTDASLPVLKADPIMPNGNGALFLFKPDKDTDITYVTNTTGVVENIAWTDAVNIVPSSTQANLRGVTARDFNSTSGKTEKTTKGGLHILASQANAVSGHGMSVAPPTILRTYSLANPSHTYYFSMWVKVTRADTNTTNQLAYFMACNATVGANNRLQLFLNTGNSPTGGRDGSLKVVGNNVLRNAAPTAWTGTIAPDNNNFIFRFQVGNKDIFTTFNLGQSGSLILYKMYIEDLTVSGRTYTAVDTIDKNLFDTVFSTGGKFDGDTYTNPSTLP